MRSGAILVATLLLLAPCFTPTATATDTLPCESPAATIAQRRGKVELRRAGTDVWVRAQIDDRVCHGDDIRTGSDGHVVWKTPDNNKQRLSRRGYVKFAEPEEDKSFIQYLREGLIYVLSRDSREIGFRTRHANGGPEGTEFVVSVDDAETEFAMLDGAVRVASPSENRRVTAGESVRVGTDGTIGPTEASGPDLLTWAYYPRIVAGPLPLSDAEPANAADADFFVRRAAARLAVGAVADALVDLNEAAALDGRDARVDALRALVAQVAGDQAQAEAFVASALRANQNSVEALLASSHVRQTSGAAARDAHAAAVRDAQRARDLAPANGLALTRLAEAYLGAERYRASTDTALEATDVARDLPEAFTVLGFALYAQRQLDEALAAFERAMQLGSMSPYTWHGAALVLWQQGRRDEAREAAEVGVILDPASVDTRSALAKLYNAEARRMLSGEQLTLAELLTPNDPTPLLIRSYLDQAQANPISALLEYRAATRRNAGRPPTRSTFALGQDGATAAFGLARIFIDTGTFALGNAVLRQQLADNPLSPAAYQLSADLAAYEPFSQATVDNDTLMHTLTTPGIESSATLQRDLQHSPTVRLTAPRDVTAPDVDVPLSEDGLEGSVSAVGGNRDIAGVSASLAFRAERLSVSGAAFDNRSDGYRQNQDREEQGRTVRLKLAPDPGTTYLVDNTSFNAETGDPVIRFFADTHGENFRITENSDALRFGLRRNTAAIGRSRPKLTGTLFVLFVRSDTDFAFDFGPSRLDASGTEYSLATRYVLETGENTFDFGASFDLLTIDQLLTGMPVTTFEDRQRVFYAYWDRKLTQSLTLTLGLNVDHRQGRDIDAGETNGKAALAWEVREGTTLRFAFSETPPPPVATTSRSNGHPDLERSRLGGFPQFVYPNTDRTRTRWAALDHEFSERLLGGVSYRQRSLSRPYLLNLVEPYLLEIEERVSSAYLNWLPSNAVSVAAIHERDRYKAPPGVGDFTHFATSRTTADFNWFMGGGLSASFRVARVHQDGNFIVPRSGPDAQYAFGHSAFTLVDVGLTFRRGGTTIDMKVNNLTDKRFNYQEPEYDFTTMTPARTFVVGLRKQWR